MGEENVVALVRSESAKEKLLGLYPSLDVHVVSYTDKEALGAALTGAGSVVHLVGIIKASQGNSYADAHEQSCEALLAACPASVSKIVYLSIVGSKPDATNACLASKGRAEEIIRRGSIAATIIQVPMVLGEGDYAAFALNRNARAKFAFTFRSASLEQPIYAGDVVSAISSALNLPGSHHLALAGPVCQSRANLIKQAARLLGNEVKVVSLPVSLGYLLAAIAERFANPPITRAMLGVLDHDDQVDVSEACERLDIELTTLDETLRNILGLEQPHQGD